MSTVSINTLKSIPAARWIATVFGVLSGIGGMLHGIGEILQGNAAPDSMLIESWTVGPVATHMGGDPAFTVVPNLLVTGILSLIVSVSMIGWALACIHRKHGGLVLIALAIAMLLVGGGFGPPTLGLLAGIGGLGIKASYHLWRKCIHTAVVRFLASLWPWVFGVCVINGLFLTVGHVIGVVFLGVTDAALFLHSFFLAVALLLVSILMGIAYDVHLTRDQCLPQKAESI
jgi:hypothetical protein